MAVEKKETHEPSSQLQVRLYCENSHTFTGYPCKTPCPECGELGEAINFGDKGIRKKHPYRPKPLPK